jgi:hypothetical protein
VAICRASATTDSTKARTAVRASDGGLWSLTCAPQAPTATPTCRSRLRSKAPGLPTAPHRDRRRGPSRRRQGQRPRRDQGRSGRCALCGGAVRRRCNGDRTSGFLLSGERPGSGSTVSRREAERMKNPRKIPEEKSKNLPLRVDGRRDGLPLRSDRPRSGPRIWMLHSPPSRKRGNTLLDRQIRQSPVSWRSWIPPRGVTRRPWTPRSRRRARQRLQPSHVPDQLLPAPTQQSP